MSRWTAPSDLKIKLPRLQTIVFILSILIAVGAVVVVAAVEVQTHPGPTKPADIDDTKVTAWISAIFTAIGAVGTAGALWLGAIVYRRQERAQHRAQSSRVFLWHTYERPTFTASDTDYPELSRPVTAHLQNGSDEPVYDIQFTWDVTWHGHTARNYPGRKVTELMPGDELMDHPPPVTQRLPVAHLYADVTFRDAAGTRWRRRGRGGQLEDLGVE